VIPIVLGSNSQPLDVGREERFVTSAIRTGLIKRDGGCVICKAPPPNCHAHHLVPWYEGGTTSLDNLVLLCGANHADVHAGHWTIRIADGVVHVSRPTWAEPSPGSRLNLRPNCPSSATDPQRPPTPWPWTGDNAWPTSAESAALNAWGDDPNPKTTTRTLHHPTNHPAPGSSWADDNTTSAQGP
jgi:hypothetical protein